MALWCGIGAVSGKSIFGSGFITTDWLVRTPRNERRNNLGVIKKRIPLPFSGRGMCFVMGYFRSSLAIALASCSVIRRLPAMISESVGRKGA